MIRRVLVVDDSALVRDLHTFMLRGGGYEVRQASNGIEALELILGEKFDLVVTDINMPKMDGLELTRRIRATDGLSTMPVILVSTESEAEDKQAGFHAGANLYVVKPAKVADLVLNARLLLGH